MKNQKDDRRSRRTRELLHQALFALMQEKRYDSITVQDIIDRANVGRSTFYAHFVDKEDLATTTIEELVELFTPNLAPGEMGDRGGIATVELFRHVQEQYQLFHTVIRSKGMEQLFERGQAYWSKKVEAYLRSNLPKGKKPSVPLPIVSNYLAGALVTLFKWWVENKMPYSPEQMDEMFQQLALPSVKAALGRAD